MGTVEVELSSEIVLQEVTYGSSAFVDAPLATQ
jgi:hypothetical protein